MSFKKFTKKDHYIYNNYEEVKRWDINLFQERIEDINQEVIFKIIEDGIKDKTALISLVDYKKI
ncbi:MAG: hypothetical protein WC942_06030 [Clostridia bacterium]|jgi:hypothetical protein